MLAPPTVDSYEKVNEDSRGEVVFELLLQHCSQLVCRHGLLQRRRLVYKHTHECTYSRCFTAQLMPNIPSETFSTFKFHPAGGNEPVKLVLNLQLIIFHISDIQTRHVYTKTPTALGSPLI